jgi:hypothetical protein
MQLNDPPKAIEMLPVPTLEAPALPPRVAATPGSAVGPALSEATGVEAGGAAQALRQGPHMDKSNILLDTLIKGDALAHLGDMPSTPTKTRPNGPLGHSGSQRFEGTSSNGRDPMGRATKASFSSGKGPVLFQNAGNTIRAPVWTWCIISFMVMLHVM